MPSAASRMLERTLSHLSSTLERAEQAHAAESSSSLAQRTDPRVKVIGVIFLTIAIVAATRLAVTVGLLVLLSLSVLLSKISWKRLLAAWTSGLFFAAIIAVPAVFTSGWQIAALLVSRSEACLTCWLLVVSTTPFNRLLRALRALRLPLVVVAILSMTFRYIFLLVETAQDMLLSHRSRMVGRLTRTQNRKLIASTTGVLLSKSIQMSDDVFHAMTSRGFRGDIYLLDDFQMTFVDWLLLGGVTAIAVAAFRAGRE